MQKRGFFNEKSRRQAYLFGLAATLVSLTSACGPRSEVSSGTPGNNPATATVATSTATSTQTGTSAGAPTGTPGGSPVGAATQIGNEIQSSSSQKLNNADPANRVTVGEVEAIAAEVDKGYADGWIDGRDPRVFKSPYKELTALQKAQFAMAYHDMVEKSDQNLAQSYKTYIPYKKRAAFARHYWENSDMAQKFKSSIEKMQVAWIHESLLDGSELWWRAAEKHFGNAINSVTQMAHDTEQNMVSKYMEDEGTESTFSQQMSVKPRAK